ncbi:MAG: NADH:flavin oxidoreductase [Clostridia bacterium]|nr:NADH:flavin oxidoreductase [Clostridia bacterium]
MKHLTLNNRIVLPPMALDIATEKGQVTHGLIEHYCRRTKGLGLIIVEHAYVSPEGKAHPNQLGIYDDNLIPGLSRLAAAIHQKGIPVGIQISHAGARAIQSSCAPSNIQSRYLKRYGESRNGRSKMACAKRIKQEDIPKMIHAFARAALRGKKAGFDFVEIHGAHGYLLNQFYSPLTNIRHDDYGGSLERRLRFPIEVVKAVRDAVGEEMPIFYRLGADDRLPYGTTLDDSIKAAAMLAEAGVDCLDLSGGICGYLKEGEEGFFSYLGKAIKPVVDIPVMVTGGIKTAEKANEIVAQKFADLVGVGRTMLKDPNWAYKEYVKLKQGNVYYERAKENNL